jgi:hypothetical protein
MDFRNPDPVPPRRIVADRWSCTAFDAKIDFTVKNLVKLAQAADPATSSLAIFAGERGLVVWGMVDQQYRHRAFVDRESETGPENPGVLRTSITGAGCLSVDVGFTTVATLRQGRMTSESYDVFGKGPISAILADPIAAIVARTKLAVGTAEYELRGHWDSSLTDDYVRTLTRIILGIQRYEHGGALLITSSPDLSALRIKYPLPYSRLVGALNRLAILSIKHTNAEDRCMEHCDRAHTIPVTLHLDAAVYGAEVDDCKSEITGCIRFISSLARVDGCIVLDVALNVRGFGAVIMVDEEPASVWLARDPVGRSTNLVPILPAHFGTRHQSMMRICYAQRGSVGLVISQDGDVRAMTRVGDILLVWEEVKLRMG